MIQIKFTTDEIEKLSYERYNYPHPKVQKKMEAVLEDYLDRFPNT